jgi:hypothetical protein
LILVKDARADTGAVAGCRFSPYIGLLKGH